MDKTTWFLAEPCSLLSLVGVWAEKLLLTGSEWQHQCQMAVGILTLFLHSGRKWKKCPLFTWMELPQTRICRSFNFACSINICWEDQFVRLQNIALYWDWKQNCLCTITFHRVFFLISLLSISIWSAFQQHECAVASDGCSDILQAHFGWLHNIFWKLGTSRYIEKNYSFMLCQSYLALILSAVRLRKPQ